MRSRSQPSQTPPLSPARRAAPRPWRRAAAQLGLLLLAATLGGPAGARSRDPHKGDWRPTDPKTIEKFCRKYDRVQGRLIIGPGYFGEDLSPLGCLNSVTGDLLVEGAPALRSLAGLSALQTPKGVPLSAIRIEANPALESIDGLNAVRGLRAQSLSIKNNPQLRSAHLRLELVSGGAIDISGNSAMELLEGPSGLPTGAALRSLDIVNNASLTSISGFDLIHSADSLTIAGNARALQITALPRLRSARELTLRGMPLLRDLQLGGGLESAERLTFTDLDALETLPALPSLSRLSHLTVTENARLRSVDGLLANRAGAPVVDRLTIEDNPALDPEGLQGLPRKLRTRPDAVRMAGNGQPPEAVGQRDEGGPDPAAP